MQFEQPNFPTPFAYQGTYAYANPTTGMPPSAQPFAYDAGYPTPAPSPQTPSNSRRRSHTQHNNQPNFMGAEYAAGKRPSSSRRHEAGEFPGHASPPYSSATSPRPSAQHRAAFMQPTPLNTPPPSASAHYSPMPNIYSYPGFSQQPPNEYFASYTPAPGPQSPPPGHRSAEGRRSRSHHHRREQTWGPETSPRSPPKATRTATAPIPESSTVEEDDLRKKAAKAGIPADYSLKNWDPSERPIILLGSVFDANSLGEWVFNWTKYHHGRTHEATRTAGGLWELLIELSSKLKRAAEFFNDIKTPEYREIVDDFMESGERLWAKLKSLLKSCEEYMWTGARRVTSPKHQEGKTKVQMGRQSGAEFVDAMFNGEKEWEKTERLIRGMATWCQRFQVNCEDILRRPDA